MTLLGLTGGVGMGKTTAASFFAQAGAPVIDTDALARELVEPGQPALIEIQRAFGTSVLDETGRLRRAALARLVFAYPAARRDLEGLLHPRIRERWQTTAAEWRRQGVALGVVVIPLLFETAAAGDFATTVCVACTTASQSRRLTARGWSAEEAAQRIAAQWPIERKVACADQVIWAEGGVELTAEQTRWIAERFCGQPGGESE
jgi:dephospho-CoA kinase